ncbi:hypothetical protein CFR73_15080 [Novacetimonas maltaceti]|uniref:CobQ/CobB/MinD/ParA nucleotide binding domain protein n=1 Tax=Novacetimonas maltaceti TaxID=1203393 RepID=A0A2S3VWZ5_9PROT|nr:AAA family ATPase [Novacetimonas maltaceti]POF61150.1 CobQ/CobB/MinD/ParA nucleotide binding domain protein [Novacetimonas maltaceti]PYD58221.1 hypothetical protein CFR73_15080 [Novacetimonas maltaceti]
MTKKALKTLAVIAQKGGTGKTTLAVNLAALAAADGLRVALVDCDPQKSAAGWWQTREAQDITLIERSASDLPTIQEAAKNDGFDLLIVDTRPSVEGETVQAIKAATVSVIPTRPGVLDLRAVASTAQLAKKAGETGVIVLNQCPPPRGIGEGALTAEARAVANTLGLPVAPPTVSMRSAFSYALNDGRAVCEYEPGGKADLELQSLWRYLKKAYLNG